MRNEPTKLVLSGLNEVGRFIRTMMVGALVFPRVIETIRGVYDDLQTPQIEVPVFTVGPVRSALCQLYPSLAEFVSGERDPNVVRNNQAALKRQPAS
jgi:hypothetical protein